MSSVRILGLHHMTAICGPAQENLDFYTGVLGLRLVKLTVNFDDPSTHHLYYGDALGSPGTILTFFPYPNGYPGRPGTGQATLTALSVPLASLKYWQERLKAHFVDVEGIRGRSLDFTAPDGLRLRLIASADHVPVQGWEGSTVPTDHTLGAMKVIILEVEDPEPTSRLLTEVLGMVTTDRISHSWKDNPTRIELLARPGGTKGRQGRGSVHHIAFRTPTDETQLELRQLLEERGLQVSPVTDRTYFKSIYFREPGGVLFEIATDPPGFQADETYQRMGTALQLPKQFQPFRTQIERALPALELP